MLFHVKWKQWIVEVTYRTVIVTTGVCNRKKKNGKLLKTFVFAKSVNENSSGLLHDVTGTRDEKWTLALTALDKERFGWTTFAALAQRGTSPTVHTLSGEFITVDIMKTWLSPVTVFSHDYNVCVLLCTNSIPW